MNWLALVSSLGAVWATGWNLFAAYRVPDVRLRPMFLLTAVFAAFYIVAWGWLAVHPVLDRGAWSEAVTPVSMMSFFIPWSAVAITLGMRTYSAGEQTGQET